MFVQHEQTSFLIIMDCQKGLMLRFFLAKELIPGYFSGIKGEYATPSGYFVDKAEEFDKGFPYMEKLKLPGQIF